MRFFSLYFILLGQTLEFIFKRLELNNLRVTHEESVINLALFSKYTLYQYFANYQFPVIFLHVNFFYFHLFFEFTQCLYRITKGDIFHIPQFRRLNGHQSPFQKVLLTVLKTNRNFEIDDNSKAFVIVRNVIYPWWCGAGSELY